ncbi:hypothetical protein [Mycobacterium sp. URHB0021]
MSVIVRFADRAFRRMHILTKPTGALSDILAEFYEVLMGQMQCAVVVLSSIAPLTCGPVAIHHAADLLGCRLVSVSMLAYPLLNRCGVVGDPIL